MQRQSHGLKTLVNQESYKQQNCLSKIETNKIPVSALASKSSIPLLQKKILNKLRINIFLESIRERRAQAKLTVKFRDSQPQNIADKA